MTENRVAEAYYRKAMTDELQKMLKAMFATIQRAYTTIPVANAKRGPGKNLRNLERIIARLQKDYSQKLERNAWRIINKYLQKANTTAQAAILKNLRKVFGDQFTINFDARKYGQLLRITAQDQARLIKTTADKLISNTTNIVYNAVKTGGTWQSVAKQLQHQYKTVGPNDIKRIARDQTAKLNAAMDYIAFNDAGIEFFRWHTKGDERVSGEKQKREGKSIPTGSHVLLDGKIFKLNDPTSWPIVDSYGNRGLPSQRVNCRCRMEHIVLLPWAKAIRNRDGSYRLLGNGKSTSELVREQIAKDKQIQQRSDQYLQTVLYK